MPTGSISHVNMQTDEPKDFWEYVVKQSNELRTKEFENKAKEIESRAKMFIENYRKINGYEIDNFEVRLEINPNTAPGQIILNYKKENR